MEPLQYAAVMGAAFVAGAINSIAGGGTLVSFPALLGVGLTGQQANITSTIALWPGSFGGFWGHRGDLAGTRRFAVRLIPPSLVGGALGATLLLTTPQKVFDALVPWLILVASLLLAANDPVARLLKRIGGHERTTGWWIGAALFQFVVGIYGGYFGAGIGILMLAALTLLGLTDIHQMNGLKNFLALTINGIAIACFLVAESTFGRGLLAAVGGAGAQAGPATSNIVWSLVGLMAFSSILGGLAGSHMAHRIGRAAIRRIVVSIGFVLAAWYFFKTYGA